MGYFPHKLQQSHTCTTDKKNINSSLNCFVYFLEEKKVR